MRLRRCLHILLMLLMVMPSMVCFKSICAAGAMAAGTMPCCKDMAVHKTVGVTLINDCLHNDLAQISAAKIPVPDSVVLFVVLAAFAFLVTPIPQRGSLWRSGRPPPDPYSDPFNILLATQRFRH